MRVLTWNVNRANRTRACWEYLAAQSPDIAFIQEVSEVPDWVNAPFAGRFETPITKDGREQRFRNAMLVRGDLLSSIPLQASREWITEELKRFRGNVFANRVRLTSGLHVNLVLVYSPAWPVATAHLPPDEANALKIPPDRSLWVTDLLLDSLRLIARDTSLPWIVAGDFNLSETFDRKQGPRGNRKFLEYLNDLQFTECLRHHCGEITPTFKHSRGYVEDQIDHLFVTPTLTAQLKDCWVPPREEIFDPVPRLSDHLPIIADFG
jgi:exonuclease III